MPLTNLNSQVATFYATIHFFSRKEDTMKYLTALSLAVSLVCFDSFSQGITSFTTSETEHYELVKPNNEPMGVLILFGGFPETPDVIKREFEIIEPAMEAGIAMA